MAHNPLPPVIQLIPVNSGFGGVISPLICQTLVTAGVPWFQFYLGSLVLSAFNTGFLALTFRPTIREWIKEHHDNLSQRKEKNGGSSATLSQDAEVKPAQRSSEILMCFSNPLKIFSDWNRISLGSVYRNDMGIFTLLHSLLWMVSHLNGVYGRK